MTSCGESEEWEFPESHLFSRSQHTTLVWCCLGLRSNGTGWSTVCPSCNSHGFQWLRLAGPSWRWRRCTPPPGGGHTHYGHSSLRLNRKQAQEGNSGVLGLLLGMRSALCMWKQIARIHSIPRPYTRSSCGRLCLPSV